MGIFKQLANLIGLTKKTGYDVLNAAGKKVSSVLAWAWGVREVWPDANAKTVIEQDYADNTAVYSIINKRARKFASIPRYLYDAAAMQNEEKLKKIINGGEAYKALMKLLCRPNETQIYSEFFEGTCIMYDSTGEAFIWLNRGDTREYIKPNVDEYGRLADGFFRDRSDEEIDKLPILEMYVLPSGFVGIIPDPTNVFKAAGYWFEVNGKRIGIRAGDIIHWKRYNPVFNPASGEHLHGLAPLKVGRRTIQQNKDGEASTDRMFKNDGSRGALVNKNLDWEELSEEARQDIKDTIDNHINNKDLKGAVATLGGEWTYLDIGKSSIDNDLLNARAFTWKELCFLLDVPHELFDTNTAYAQKKDVKRDWVSDSIGPGCKSLDEKLTGPLTTSFGLKDKVIICSDVTALPEMQKDLAALITALDKAWYITPNQKLIILGFDPSGEEILDEQWVPMGVTPLSDVGVDVAQNKGNKKLNDDELDY